MTRYAVVISQGRYGSGELVGAAIVTSDRRKALALARRWTSQHQEVMARYGGTSGGYRVVETEERTARTAWWYGMDLDRTAGVQ